MYSTKSVLVVDLMHTEYTCLSSYNVFVYNFDSTQPLSCLDGLMLEHLPS